MTQYAKEAIRKSILTAARKEFLRSGYTQASIRTIATRAKTSKSNLYNYFSDKDALFCAVLEPVVSEIRRGLESAALSAAKDKESYTMQSQGMYMRIVMEFVAAHPKDIGLLLRAEGSPLSGFKDEVLDKFTDMLTGWLAGAVPERVFSRLFIRCVAGFYISSIERILADRPSPETAQAYMKEFLAFVYGGWRSLMDLNSEDNNA